MNELQLLYEYYNTLLIVTLESTSNQPCQVNALVLSAVYQRINELSKK